MGSELVSGLPVPTGLRKGVGREGGLRGVDARGERVSLSKLPSSSTSVVPVSESIDWPQDEQNFAFRGTLLPQAKQNMRVSKFITRFNHRANAANDSGKALHMHGRAVGKNFGNALHHFRSVVAHANHGIGAMLAGVLQKKLEGIFARSLAQIRK